VLGRAQVIEHADAELRNKVQCLHQCVAKRVRQHVFEATEVRFVVSPGRESARDTSIFGNSTYEKSKSSTPNLVNLIGIRR
jgi:hypothetical protein